MRFHHSTSRLQPQAEAERAEKRARGSLLSWARPIRGDHDDQTLLPLHGWLSSGRGLRPSRRGAGETAEVLSARRPLRGGHGQRSAGRAPDQGDAESARAPRRDLALRGRHSIRGARADPGRARGGRLPDSGSRVAAGRGRSSRRADRAALGRRDRDPRTAGRRALGTDRRTGGGGRRPLPRRQPPAARPVPAPSEAARNGQLGSPDDLLHRRGVAPSSPSRSSAPRDGPCRRSQQGLSGHEKRASHTAAQPAPSRRRPRSDSMRSEESLRNAVSHESRQ